MSVDITSLTIAVTSQGISQASQALGGLSASALNTEKRIAALISTMQRLQVVSGATNAQAGSTSALTAALNALNTTIAQLNQRTTQATQSQRQHNDAMREAHGLARGLSGSLGALWLTYGALGGMLLGVALGASIKAAITGFTAVEYQMTMAKALTEDTTNSVKSLTASMHEVSLALGISPEAAAKGLRALAQAGLSTKEALATLPAAFKLATVGEMELEAAALAATGVMNAYGMKVRDLEFIGDTMAKAGAMSAASVTSIAVSMKYAAGTAEQYGVSLEKLSTILTLLGKRGITGSSAGVAANNLIAEIYSPSSEKAIKAQAALGVKAYVDGVRQSLDTSVDSIKQGLAKFDSESQGKLLEDMLGKKGGKGFYAIAKANQQEFLAMEQELVGAAGFTAEVYKQSLQTIQGQMNLTKAAITNMFAQVGEESSTPIKALLTAVRNLANMDVVKDAFVGLSQSIKTFVTYVVPASAALGALWLAMKAGPPLIAAVTYAMSIFSAAGFAAAYGAVGAAVTGLIGAFQAGNLLMIAANPIVAALAGVLAILAGAYFLLKRNKESVMDMHGQEMANSEEAQKELKKEIELIDKKIAAQRKGLSGDALEGEIKRLENEERLQEMRAAIVENEVKIKTLSGSPQRSDGAELARQTQISALTKEGIAMTKALEAKKINFDKEAALNAIRIQKLKEFGEEQRLLRIGEQLAEDGQETPTSGDKKYGVKEDKAGKVDALQAKLNTLQSEIKAAKKQAETEKAAAQSEYKQGLIGEIALIEKVRESEVNKQASIAEAANNKLKSMQGIANKESEIASARSEIQAAMEATTAANKTAESSKAEMEIANAKKLLKFESDAFESKRQYANAYKAEFEADHNIQLERLQDNINKEVDVVKQGELEKLKAHMEAAYDAGVGNAENRDAVNAFNVSVEATRNALKGVQTATEGNGIVSMFEAAQAASTRFANDLPALREKMGKLTNPKDINEAQAELTRLAETQRKMWVGVGESISKSLEGAFGKGGKAAAALIKVVTDYGKTEKKDGSARIKAYGDAAGAAAGFFDEQSKGYKVLMGVSKAFHAMEVAQLLISNVQKGISAVLNQANGDPYTAFARMAAMGAIVAGLGIAIAASSGGGGGASSAQRQASQGKGSVLGDADAKSESISKSLEIMERNSGLGLAQGNMMVTYLRAMATGISSLASLVVRTAGVTGGYEADKMGGLTSYIQKNLFSKFDPLFGGFINKIVGKIGNAIFGGKTSVTDTGFAMEKDSLGDMMSNGVKGYQYTDVKKDGGLFRGDKYSTDWKNLPTEANAQFGKIITSMANTLTEAGKMMGIGGDSFTAKLKTFVIDIKNISFKDMKGDEIQKAIENVFSKLGDDMAKFAITGLDEFTQVGEGYLETVVRVVNDLMQVRDVFAVLDKTFALTGVAAIRVSESLIEAAGGLEKLTGGTQYFVDNFLTEAEKMGPITSSVAKRLKELNLVGITTIELYKKKIRALDLTNSADQALYASLLELAPAFKEVMDYSDKLAQGTESLTAAQKKALKVVEDARSNLEKAYDSESGALQGVIDKTKGYIATLKDFQNSLKLGSNSPLTNMEKYAEARNQFNTVSAAAKGGDVAAQQKFTSIANEFLNASKIINASGNGYTADFNAVQSMTSNLVDAAIGQVDVATASLAALNKQVEGLISIDKSVMSVTQAISELSAAILAGKTAGLSDTSMGVVNPVTGTVVQPAATDTNVLVGAITKLTAQVAQLQAVTMTTTGVIVGAVHEAASTSADTIVEGVGVKGGSTGSNLIKLV